VKRRSREINVFSMSFLDAITAGSAVVLLFMLVSQNAMLDSNAVINDMTAEAQRWSSSPHGAKELVALKDRLSSSSSNGPSCARSARTSERGSGHAVGAREGHARLDCA
jgi:hypothetical protein